jgi:hypothetical protein
VAAQDQGLTTADGTVVGLGEDTHLNGSSKLGNLMRCYAIYTLLLADRQQRNPKFKKLNYQQNCMSKLLEKQG